MAVGRFSQLYQGESYVKPFDLSVYQELIGERQRTFDTNLKALSGSLAKYTNLPIPRAIDKEYIGEKMQNLTQRINSLQISDYSDPSSVAYINSMISEFGNDGRIKNALISGTELQNDDKMVDEFRKSDKYSESNEHELRAAQASYLRSNDPNLVYKSPGMRPWEGDPLKDAVNLVEGAAKGQTIDYDTIGPDGKPTVVKLKYQDLDESKLYDIAYKFLDSNKIAQLQRDGKFHFRGITEEETDDYSKQWIVGAKGNSIQRQISATQGMISQTNILMANADQMGNTEVVKELQNKIEGYQRSLETYNNQLKDNDFLYKEGVKELNSLKYNNYLDMRLQSISKNFAVHSVDASKIGNTGKSTDGSISTNSDGSIDIEKSGGSFYMDPATEANAWHTKKDLLTSLQSVQSQLGVGGKLGSLALNQIQGLRNQNPLVYGNMNDAQLTEVYNNFAKMYEEGKMSSIKNPDLVNHFTQIQNLKAEKWSTESLLKQADAKLKADPNYQRALNALKASEKAHLQDFYELEIQTGKPTLGFGDNAPDAVVKKRYSKEALLNFMKAMELSAGYAVFPSMMTGSTLGNVISDPLKAAPFTRNIFNAPIINDIFQDNGLLSEMDGDNSLIQDINSSITNMNAAKNKDSDFKKDAGRAAGFYLRRTKDVVARLTGNDPRSSYLGSAGYDIVNPLAYISGEGGDKLRQHLEVRERFSKLINEKEEEIYNGLGYTELMPTYAPSAENKVQNNYINGVQGLLKGDEKQRKVTAWTGIKLLPNDMIQIGYSYKEGQNENSDVIVTTRDAAGTFGQFLPPDKNRVLQGSLRVNGGTSPYIQDAFHFNFGNKIVPYRMHWRPNGKIALQIFENGVLNSRVDPALEFNTVDDLQRNGYEIVRKLYQK